MIFRDRMGRDERKDTEGGGKKEFPDNDARRRGRTLSGYVPPTNGRAGRQNAAGFTPAAIAGDPKVLEYL